LPILFEFIGFLRKAFFFIILAFLFSAFDLSAVCYPSLQPSSQSNYANFWYDIFSPVSFLLPPHYPKKVIYETKSNYSEIRVYDDGEGWRYLVFLPEYGYQSVLDTKNPEVLVSQYAKLSFLAIPALGQESHKVLFIGMGGAIMPTYFRHYYPDAQIDIVDIDNSIPSIAETYFNFKANKNTKVYIEDGRKFIEETNDKYDIIFLDVYDAETIPQQFTTEEFFQLLRMRLSPEGVLSLNLANFSDKFVLKIFKSVKSAFPNTYAFLTENEHNYVLISLNSEEKALKDLELKSLILDSRNTFNINFQTMLNPVTIIKE